MLIAGGGGGDYSAAMKTCPERKKRMREFYLREKNVTYTSNLSTKLMSQQKDQMDQNDLLRKRAQDLAQENLILNACVAKLEFKEKTAIKAEQLSEILKRIFHHIIPFHEHGPIVSKRVHLLMQGDINDVMQGGNPPSSPPPNASPLSTSTTTSRETIEWFCLGQDNVILTGDFNSKHEFWKQNSKTQWYPATGNHRRHEPDTYK